MIPMTVHTVWPNSTVEMYNNDPDLTHFAEFIILHPEWHQFVWRNPGATVDPRLVEFLPHISNIASISDLMRYSLLLKHGGVYIDLDVLPLQSFEPLLELGAFAGWEDSKRLCNAVMGFEAGHPALDEFIDYMAVWVADHILQTDPPMLTGPLPFTNFFGGRDDLTRLPPISFYPFHYTEPNLVGQFEAGEIQAPSESYCVHLWHKGWAK